MAKKKDEKPGSAARQAGAKTPVAKAAGQRSAEGNLEALAQVGVIMGSDSDLEVMAEAARMLGQLGIAHEVTIVSAHRTPLRMVDYARSAATRGIKVIIAGAGGAAHLPGMVASLTVLPVVGVPILSRSLQGLDSLLSIVQMPTGVPVATVAINSAANAALLAARILATTDDRLSKRLERYQQEQEIQVLSKANRLETDGWELYTASLPKS